MLLRDWHVAVSLTMTLAFAAQGCGGGNEKGPKFPRLSPAEAGAAAIAELDANKDGSLDAKELEKCPALRERKPDGTFGGPVPTVDKDANGKITAEEIATRLREYETRKVALVGVSCQVALENVPLTGATVTFTPEAFMGTNVKPAQGVSEEGGEVNLQIEGEGFPGLHCGFYRVTVSKKDAQGKETIPARFNTNTTLGFEVGPDMREGNFLIRITRR
jgi:hypothetical protein